MRQKLRKRGSEKERTLANIDFGERKVIEKGE
jgi:hypothetical protein